jgi:Mrp family chromosome partitioning ATPase
MGIVADAVNSVKDSGANIIGCVLNAKKKLVANHYYSKNRYYKKYYSYKGYYKKKKYTIKHILSGENETAVASQRYK